MRSIKGFHYGNVDLRPEYRPGWHAFNSILGFPHHGDPGDEFFSDNPRDRSLAVGEIVPLGVDGVTFNVEATDARTTPEASAGAQASDQFGRLSVSRGFARAISTLRSSSCSTCRTSATG
jgi:hypothetical protein